MLLSETAESFEAAGFTLRGMLHRAATNSASWGLVICPPFGEERKSAARVMTLAARALGREGFHVLRFDYRGTGESDGEMADAGPRQWAEDIRGACRHLAVRTGADQIGLLGIRFGAALAAMASRESAPSPFLAAWAPLWSGRSCLEEIRRHLAATRLVVDGPRGEPMSRCAACNKTLDIGGFSMSPGDCERFESAAVFEEDKVDVVIALHLSGRAATAEENRSMCRRLTSRDGAWRAVAVAGRPFWVTASRYDPQPLVDSTVRALKECGVSAQSYSDDRGP